MAGEQDDFDGRIEAADFLKQLHAAEAGHHKVGDDDPGGTVANNLERLLRVGGADEFEILDIAEGGLEEGQGRGVVIDRQKGNGHETGSSSLARVRRMT